MSKLAEFYELRQYPMIATRMPDFHDLLGVKVPPLFAKNGIPKPLAFWESYAGPFNPLYCYLIPWDSVDTRIRTWDQFYADPVWQEALAKNYGGEQRVHHAHVSILKACEAATEFMTGETGPVTGIQEMVVTGAGGADAERSLERLLQVDLPAFRDAGGRVLGVFRAWTGIASDLTFALLAWGDENQMHLGHRAATEKETGLTVNVRYSQIMIPIEYGIPQGDLYGLAADGD